MTGESELFAAVARGDVETVTHLLERAGVSANTAARRSLRLTPLTLAATRGNAAIVRVLLAHGAHVHLHSPLVCAVESGAEAATAALLEHGADPNAVDARGERVLCVAMRQVPIQRALVYLLLAHGAHVAARNRRGEQALHVAATAQNLEIIEVLITHGADVDARDASGCTALHRAATENADQAVRVLVAHGADVDALDRRGKTPLHYAALHTDASTLTALLRLGATAVVRDADGLTPLCYAARFGKLAAVHTLLRADGVLDDLTDATAVGGALYEAVAQGRADVVAVLVRAIQCHSRELQPALVFERALASARCGHHQAVVELLAAACATVGS